MIQKLFSNSEIRRRKRVLRIKQAREMELPEDFFSVEMTLDLLSERCCAASFSDLFFVNAYQPSGSSEIQTQLFFHGLREMDYVCLLLIPLQRTAPLLRSAPWIPDTVLVKAPSRMVVPESFSTSYLSKPCGATFRLFRFQVNSFFLAVGLAYFSQEISPVPRECHDEKMDVLRTENKRFWF